MTTNESEPSMSEPDEVIKIWENLEFSEDIMGYGFMKNIFSDITLVVDGQEIPAHKIVLVARSKCFEALLCQDPSQSKLVIEVGTAKVFKAILKYIYTGTFTIPSSDVNFLFEALTLARNHSLLWLEKTLSEKVSQTLNMDNVFAALNKANQDDIDELKSFCHTFIDKNLSEMSQGDYLNVLTQKAMVGLLERDSFSFPEIQIFQIAASWCKVNEDRENLVMQCVRLSNLSHEEIVSVVWPSKLVEETKLLGAIAEKGRPRLSGQNGDLAKSVTTNGRLLTEITPFRKIEHTILGQKNVITVDLEELCCCNHVEMSLHNNDLTFCHYIEISTDCKNWIKILDYSSCHCRGRQNLYFEKQEAQFIRIVCEFIDSTHEILYLASFRASFEQNCPKLVNNIVCPLDNVATSHKGAHVIQGETRSLNFCSHGYNESIVVQLAQPFMVSSLKFCTISHVRVPYTIRTSVDKRNWEIAVDRKTSNYETTQNLYFRERSVVYIKIEAKLVYDRNNPPTFHYNYFECPSSVKV